MPEQCEHQFEKFSIAMIGIRWQCILCDLIAPPCFTPVESAKAPKRDDEEAATEKFFAEHFVIVKVP